MKKQKRIIIWVSVLLLIALCFLVYLIFKLKIYADTSNPTQKVEIRSITGDDAKRVVITTGAVYEIMPTGMTMTRRIDPKTNSYNPRLVAELSFDKNAGPIKLISGNINVVNLESDLFKIQINPDSFFIITSKFPFSYTHKNLIKNATYNKPDINDSKLTNLTWLDRMWTDGYGGSLHAYISGTSKVIAKDINTTTIEMSSGAAQSHMIFPSKGFDFNKLYGQDSKPFINTIFYNDVLTKELPVDLSLTTAKLQLYKDAGVGTFILWSTFYDCNWDFDPKIKYECYRPVELTPGGSLGYRIHPQLEQKVKDFIAEAHRLGLKVVPDIYTIGEPEWKYPAGHPKAGQYQDIETSLQFLKDFKAQYDFDGWYLDGGAHASGRLIDNYNFARSLRQAGGDNSVIIFHNSVDPWAINSNAKIDPYIDTRYDGLRAIMLDTYADYTIAGETGPPAATKEINDQYYRFFSSGYGLSQAIGTNIERFMGASAIRTADFERLMAGNLNGGLLQWDMGNSNKTAVDNPFYKGFISAYSERKNEYLSGKFNPDVKWPIDNAQGWYRLPNDIEVKYNNDQKTSVSISWATDEASTGNVEVASSNPDWFHPQFQAKDDLFATKHAVTIDNLSPEVSYQFRIMSTNNKTDVTGITWAYVGELETLLDRRVSFPSGFSTFGNTQQLDKEFFNNNGLIAYKYFPEMNSWMLSSKTLSRIYSLEGAYVYNSGQPKTILLPYNNVAVNPYKTTAGWNMLWSAEEKDRSSILLAISGQGIKTVNEWINLGKVREEIYIIDNDQATEKCSYFKLLTSTDSLPNCATNQLGTIGRIPAGKAFWVYVR